MFADIERMDAHAWASYLAPDAIMRFGNDEPIYGRDGCQAALEALYARIDGLRHDLVELWEHGEATIVEANVTYTRRDGQEATVPVVTIYRTDANELISDYRVYIDTAPVFDGPPEIAASASSG
jgi:ketosteroid isomerase-like protein